MGHIPVFTGAGAPREQREGWAVREPRLRVVNNEGFSSMGAIYFHSNHGRGRPRGAPLRGLGKIRKWEGRCGQGGGGMGPRMREDNGGGRDGFPSAILARKGSPREQREGMGGSRTARTERGKTRASAAWGQSIFIAITGEGAHGDAPTGAGEDS